MTSRGGTVFIIDASVWIRAHERTYPPDVFPSLWTHLAGVVKSPRQVIPELGSEKAGVGAWLGIHKAQIVLKETAQVQREAGQVISSYPGLVSIMAKDSADPWIVAFAKVGSHTVVTEEVRSQNATRPKIPNVCDDLDVDCINTIEFFRRIKARL